MYISVMCEDDEDDNYDDRCSPWEKRGCYGSGGRKAGLAGGRNCRYDIPLLHGNNQGQVPNLHNGR